MRVNIEISGATTEELRAFAAGQSRAFHAGEVTTHGVTTHCEGSELFCAKAMRLSLDRAIAILERIRDETVMPAAELSSLVRS